MSGSFNPPVRTPDFLITELDGGSKLARSRDKPGKPWPAVLPAATRGLWKADVNGSRTYYFAAHYLDTCSLISTSKLRQFRITSGAMELTTARESAMS